MQWCYHFDATGKWSDTEITALVLSATCRLNPDDSRLPAIARWLVTNRKGNHWHSTRDTAFVLYALTDYLLVTEELAADMDATVKLNEEKLAQRHFGRRDAFRPESEIEVPPDKLKSGPLKLLIEKTGTGRLYYTAELSQYLDVDLTARTPSACGITVERTYKKLERKVTPGEFVDEAAGPTEQLSYTSGDVIEVTLTVRSDAEREYIMLEDPIPAGCEVADQGRLRVWEWDYWWADRTIRDELVAFAITHLGARSETLTYKLVTQIPGEYSAMPTEVYNMYDPTIRATGTADTITIAP